MKKNLLSLLGGVLFGVGLAISGMTDPLKVVAFLDIFGFWDPTLLFVMGGALATFTLGYRLMRGSFELPSSGQDSISRELIIGALIFGVGWGLGGFCPGPAIANLGALWVEAMVFVPTMAVGMFLAQRIYRLDT